MRSDYGCPTLCKVMAEESDEDACGCSKDGVVVDCLQAWYLETNHMAKTSTPTTHTVQHLTQ